MKKRIAEYCGQETKKEFIIKVSQEDPFLRIEEIANLASTTPRYVRTILSEANLSLMDLRKKYARKMEKDKELKIMISFKDNDSVVNIHTETDSSAITYGLPQRVMLESSEDFNWNFEGDTLYQYFQHVYYYKRPVGLLIMTYAKKLNDNQLEINESIFQQLGLRIDHIKLTRPEIEMGNLSNFSQLQSFQLELPQQNSIIKMKTFLTRNKKIIGEEIFYFSSDYVKLIIPGFFNPVLELTKDSV